MNLDIIRWIDRYIGVPICLFISIFYHIIKLSGLSKRKQETQLKKALFIELSEMGSTILAYPAIKKLKDSNPNCELYFLIFDENKDSVKLLNLIPPANILTIRVKSPLSFILDTITVLFKIRRLKFDVVFDLELFARFTAILTGISGSKLKVGFYKYTMESLYRGDLLTHKVAYNPHMHISLNFLSLSYSIISPKKEIPMTKRTISDSEIQIPKLLSNQAEINTIHKKLKLANPEFNTSSKIVIFNPNAGFLPIRAWPLKNYIGLAKKILKDYKNIFIVIIGVKEASKDARQIKNSVGARCIDLTNKTTLKEVIDLYNISKILVTNDSGPAHFASLTPIKNIVFFGPETPKLYSPLGKNCIPIYSNFACSPCVSAFNHRKTICKDNKCLQSISVDKVYSILKKEL